jgi:hypothetical protein
MRGYGLGLPYHKQKYYDSRKDGRTSANASVCFARLDKFFFLRRVQISSHSGGLPNMVVPCFYSASPTSAARFRKTRTIIIPEFNNDEGILANFCTKHATHCAVGRCLLWPDCAREILAKRLDQQRPSIEGTVRMYLGKSDKNVKLLLLVTSGATRSIGQPSSPVKTQRQA